METFAVVRTKDLSGAALDWAVEVIELEKLKARGEKAKAWYLDDLAAGLRQPMAYSQPALAAEIIDREKIATSPHGNEWLAAVSSSLTQVEGSIASQTVTSSGPSQRVAALRCYVRKCRGDMIEVPVVFLAPAATHHDVQEAGRPVAEFVFDVKVFGLVTVEAESEDAARAMLANHLDGATLQAGFWPNGKPIVFEAGVDGEADLVEMAQGAVLSDGTTAVPKD